MDHITVSNHCRDLAKEKSEEKKEEKKTRDMELRLMKRGKSQEDIDKIDKEEQEREEKIAEEGREREEKIFWDYFGDLNVV